MFIKPRGSCPDYDTLTVEEKALTFCKYLGIASKLFLVKVWSYFRVFIRQRVDSIPGFFIARLIPSSRVPGRQGEIRDIIEVLSNHADVQIFLFYVHL